MKRQKTFSQKLFLTYSTAILLVLFLLSVFSLFIVYREQYEKNLETRQQLVSKTQEQIDASLISMDGMINSLMFDRNFLDIMGDENAELNYTQNSRQVLNSLAALDAPLFSTHRIIAFNNKLYYTLGKTGENEPYIQAAIADYPWWNDVIAADGRRVILPLHADSFDPQGDMVYSVARAIIGTAGPLGIVEVQNSYQRLEGFCDLEAATGEIAVFSPENGLVYPLEPTPEQAALFSRLLKEIGPWEQGNGNLRSEGIQVVYSFSAYSGFLTFLYIPVARMNPFVLELVMIFIITFILLAGASLLLFNLLTKRLIAPLIDLNQALSEVSLHNLSLVLPDSHGITEIDTINHSFDLMFHELKRAIAQNVQARANEERANYLALESQMNPHTIYNTIAMIESVSYMNGDKEVSALCICFSQMLRYISDFTERPYTVKDELQHLNNYATLIMKRYDGRLTIDTHTDPELDSHPLPKFTIQPLVENAVQHGLRGADIQLCISVFIQKGPHSWYILVKDNGRGFTPDRLDEITRQFAQCDETLEANDNVVNRKIGNLALSNIYVRCRILYGEGFSMHANNNPGASGAYVRLEFTKEEEQH